MHTTASTEHAEAVRQQGFTIVRDAIPDELRRRVLDTIDRLMVDLDIPFGPNGFLGRRTRRIFNLLARDPIFAEVALHAPVLGVAEQVLDEGLLLSSMTAIEMHPGQAAQPLHSDDGSTPLPRPHVPIACPAIWALTDFTSANGATRLVPGSHRRDRIPRPGETVDDPTEAVMDAGSVLVYDGSLWHGGGPNATDERRVGIVVNYCAGWIRQEENQLLAIDRGTVAGFPDRLRRMVGYSTYRGLTGHVDQRDPAGWFDDAAGRPMVWEKMR